MRTLRFLAISIVLLPLIQSSALAQDEQYQQCITVQPIIWLDSLFPKRIVGIAGQYEYPFTGSHSFVGRVTWFRGPEIMFSDQGVGGIAATCEYRCYFAHTSQGWHIGPFAELNRYTRVGATKGFYGNKFESVFDFGVLAGHKWISNRFVFDLSVRSAFYFDSPTVEGLFPSPSSSFNSHFILSAGITI